MNIIGRKKLSIIGTGNIGSVVGQLASLFGIFNDICLFDMNQDSCSGKALDLLHSHAILGKGHVRMHGCSSYEPTANSDVIVVTAGMPRKPGMSREDLLGHNTKIIKMAACGIAEFSANSFIIVVTNPLDSMVNIFREVGDFLPSMVVGMAGLLDTARFRYLLADALGVLVDDVSGIVIGSHNDKMVPLLSSVAIGGVALSHFIAAKKIDKQKLDEIIHRTKNGGTEIVNLLKTGSAFFAPAASILKMAHMYVSDAKSLVPASCYLSGQYSHDGLYVGVPAIIGARGVEGIVEMQLTAEEKSLFDASVDAIAAENKKIQEMEAL